MPKGPSRFPRLRDLRQSYGVRIYVFVVVTLLAVVGALTVTSARRESRLLEANARREGTVLAEAVARQVRLGVLTENRGLLDESLAQALEHQGVERAAVYDRDLRVIDRAERRSAASVRAAGGAADAPPVESLLRTRVSYVAERDDAYTFWAPVVLSQPFKSDEALYYADTRPPETRVEGFVALTVSKAALNDARRALVRHAAGFGAAMLVVAAALTALAIGQASRPLAGTLRRARELGLPVSTPSDGGWMPRDSFGRLLKELQGAFARIAELTEGLEHKVAERTEELAKANAELREARDHLEEKVLERTEALERTHRQLLHSEKLTAVGRLSASLAHEINNPLCGIRNVLQGLQRTEALPDSQAELVQMAVDECDRLATLIRALQGFYRPTSGALQPVDLNRLMGDVLLLTRKEASRREVNLVEALSPELPPVVGVSDQLKQVFLNLLTNALDATPAGGTVRVASGFENGREYVRVADTGCGIAPDHLERVFEPFFSTKPEVKGTGLGLSISFGIVKSHQGEIEVESRPGEGSSFTVWIPRKWEEEPC